VTDGPHGHERCETDRSTMSVAERPSFVVIGTSAGGENALVQVFKNLPAAFPGAVLVVIHVGLNAVLSPAAGRINLRTPS
jgi:chemotaxis response regulator CheB